jgi:hypothetical protein
MADNLYLGRDGRQMGPFAWAQIASMASSGQVLPGDLAWHDGMAEWQPAESVLSRLGLNLPSVSSPRPPAVPPVPPGGLLAGLLARRARG